MPSLATLKAIFTFAPWVAILLILGWGARVNDLRDRWHHQYEAEHAGRLSDRTSYENAQKAAEAQNKAQIQRVETQQQRITNDADKRYQADLARLRAELGKRLQQGGTPATQGSAGNPGAPQVPDTTGKLDGPATVSIPASLYVRGAELELQLERLQQWVAEQVKVDPNK
jgi:hypothetical protein